MQYQEAVSYIESLSRSPQSPSLERIRSFLAQYDCPENSFSSLHIAGTNGKGSTVAILDSILRSSKLKVARYTGPHLLRWNERFHINGLPIEDAEFARRVARLKLLSERFGADAPHFGCLTWFEFITVLAFFFFAENQVDIAVIEVGLGGRFDATNVLAKPLATGITNVSLDHTQILGETIEEIAFEKAGIIKPAIPLITAAQEPALSVIRKRAAELNALVIHCQEQMVSTALESALPGVHQKMNAQVALRILETAGLIKDHVNGSDDNNGRKYLSKQDVNAGLARVYWPGRLQIIESIGLILDGAHNLAGVQALRASLDDRFPRQTFRFVFACYENKDALSMLKALVKPGDSLYVSEVDSSRTSFPKANLARCALSLDVAANTYTTIGQALRAALSEKKDSEYAVATGSFATVKESMLAIGWSSVEDGQQIG